MTREDGREKALIKAIPTPVASIVLFLICLTAGPEAAVTAASDASGGLPPQAGSKMDERQGTAELKTYSEDLGNGVTIEMTYIPGGEFMMGSEENPAEGPVRKVTVKPFWMGRYEVTNEQWLAAWKIPVVGRAKSKSPFFFQAKAADPKSPVDAVLWDDAIEVLRRLSKKSGKRYRLPTEAEWEYACRAGTTTRYHFGDGLLPHLANYSVADEKTRRDPRPVGSSGPPNAFGLYDMHGNVAEWVADLRHKNYSGAPDDSRAWVKGGEKHGRILRGGASGFGRASDFRCASRFLFTRRASASGFGFRIVADVDSR
jgi:formylglycine-generating enzyme required for sulfatase activity